MHAIWDKGSWTWYQEARESHYQDPCQHKEVTRERQKFAHLLRPGRSAVHELWLPRSCRWLLGIHGSTSMYWCGMMNTSSPAVIDLCCRSMLTWTTDKPLLFRGKSEILWNANRFTRSTNKILIPWCLTTNKPRYLRLGSSFIDLTCLGPQLRGPLYLGQMMPFKWIGPSKWLTQRHHDGWWALTILVNEDFIRWFSNMISSWWVTKEAGFKRGKGMTWDDFQVSDQPGTLCWFGWPKKQLGQGAAIIHTLLALGTLLVWDMDRYGVILPAIDKTTVCLPILSGKLT